MSEPPTLHTIRFPFGSDGVARRERQALGRLACGLIPGRDLLITGYTDDIGPQAYNDALASGRAKAVARVLIEAGIDRGRIALLGRGKANYLESNETLAGRAQNRRVEVRYAAGVERAGG